MVDDGAEARAHYRQACEEVRERVETIFSWRQLPRWNPAHDSILDIALDHLTLARAHLGLALTSPAPDFTTAAEHLNQAVTGLRDSGNEDDIPRALLARATLHRLTNNPAAARADLTEAEDIATRGHMRLHEADVHLEWTRLCLATRKRKAAREHLAKARALVEATGYGRRTREVEWLVARLLERPTPPATAANRRAPATRSAPRDPRRRASG